MRKYARYNLLKSKKFLSTVTHVWQVFPKHSWVLIGGLAVAHYANPPVTVDVDILFDNKNYSEFEIPDWINGEIVKWKSRPLWFMTGLAGFPRKGIAFSKKGHADIDVLFTGKDKFLRSAVDDHEVLKIGGFSIPVIAPENLIIMKTLAGREKDDDDVAALWGKLGDDLDNEYINKTLSRLS